MDKPEELGVNEPAVAKEAPERKSAVISFFKELPFLILGAFLIAWVIKSFVVQPFKIEQQSMFPTLHPSDRVFVNKFIYRLREPERGEIITFRAPQGDRILIKRIIATEGETIRIKKGRVFINKKPIKEGYLRNSPDFQDYPATRIPRDAIFVMGDNRPNSGDSRMFGAVPERNLLGKAFLIYWPADHWKIIR